MPPDPPRGSRLCRSLVQPPTIIIGLLLQNLLTALTVQWGTTLTWWESTCALVSLRVMISWAIVGHISLHRPTRPLGHLPFCLAFSLLYVSFQFSFAKGKTVGTHLTLVHLLVVPRLFLLVILQCLGQRIKFLQSKPQSIAIINPLDKWSKANFSCQVISIYE